MTPDGNSHSELANLDDYATDIGSSLDQPDYRTLEGYRYRDGSRFFVEFAFGYDLQVGFARDAVIREPDTLYIADCRVTAGQGLGSAAVARLLEHARSNSYNVGRMAIIDPRMIGVVRKLQRLDIIHEAFFRMVYGEGPSPHPATQAIRSAGDLISADEASTQFTPIAAEVNRRMDADEDISAIFAVVDCVIFF